MWISDVGGRGSPIVDKKFLNVKIINFEKLGGVGQSG